MSKKIILFDCSCGFNLCAICENGKLTEFDFEKLEKGIVCGNIYKGRVEKVLPGMQAAFIDCGLEKNCYLSSASLCPEGAREEELPVPELKEGDEIMVQITKLPSGVKGAKVTASPSFVGKSIIYLPASPFIGVSQRLDDGELRKNLIFSVKKLLGENEGAVVRAAGPYAKRGFVAEELNGLRKLYFEICEKFKTAKVGDLIYKGLSLPKRVLRDTLSSDIEKIIVSDDKLLKEISALTERLPASTRPPVEVCDGDILDCFGIAGQICEAAEPKVNLSNGAYLVIEKTEALTVIDVNTGGFTGDYNLEQTVYHTNILAAREIARQVKLRNIGGIVIVDFIDMTKAEHRKALSEELEKALKGDSAKCSVSPMSKLGLVEFSRKQIGSAPLRLMVESCKHCSGSGKVKTVEFSAMEIRARLRNFANAGVKKVRIDASDEILKKLEGWQELKEFLLSHLGDMQVYLVGHKNFDSDKVRYKTDEEEDFSLPANCIRYI